MKSFPVTKLCLPSQLASELSAAPALAGVYNNVVGQGVDLLTNVASSATVLIGDEAPDSEVLAVIAAHMVDQLSYEEMMQAIRDLSPADRDTLLNEMLCEWLTRGREGAMRAKVKIRKKVR